MKLMRSYVYLLIGCLLFITMGCKKDIPKPETNIDVYPIINTDLRKEIPASSMMLAQSDPFFVKYQVKGKEVLIECIVQGITFRETNANNKGKIVVYVDGKKKDEVSSAAFIIKGLPSGTHHLKLQAVKTKDSSYNLQKEFYITIP